MTELQGAVAAADSIFSLMVKNAKLLAALEEAIGALKMGYDWQIWKAEQIEAALANEQEVMTQRDAFAVMPLSRYGTLSADFSNIKLTESGKHFVRLVA